MEIRWGLPGLALLCFLMHARGKGERCVGVDIYPRPRPPPHPQPGHSDNGGGSEYLRPISKVFGCNLSFGYFNDVDRDDGRYPPRPKPRPPAGGGGGGGGGGYPNYDSSGNSYGGDEHSTYGNPQGNMVAKIVSPIVSVVVVTLLGAAASYFKMNRRGNCLRTNGKCGSNHSFPTYKT
uniref:Xg glycoprotein (Xg blood group) n=1 Tax=Microcebus murinus TaxID=30608 RepID=A0A8C5XSU7_MICMU